MAVPASMHAVHPAARRCLELAHAGLRAGGLPVGAVLLDDDGSVAAEGRNEVYDDAGTGRLSGSPLAHAETTALAGTTSAVGLSGWSSHRPCAMCAAALAFVGIDRVQYLAEDPSTPFHRTAAGDGSEHHADPTADRLATALFLLGCSPRTRDAAVGPVADLVRAGGADALRDPDLWDAAATVPWPG